MKSMNSYRKRLDKIDAKIAKDVAEKIKVVKEFWDWKKANNIPIVDKKREAKIEKDNSKLAGLRKEFMKKIFHEIRKEIKKQWKR